MAHCRPPGGDHRRVLDEVPDARRRAGRRHRATPAAPGSRSSASRQDAVARPPLSDRTGTGPAASTPDFAWPDFDRWQAAFAAVGFFPPRWKGLERPPLAHSPETEAYRLRKLALFCEWRDMVANRPAVRAHYARQGIRTRVERQEPRPSC